MIFLIRCYQASFSAFFGKCCRFYPSCSQYMLEAIEQKGVLKGLLLGTKRLLKCGPWHSGGIDLVADADATKQQDKFPII